MNIKVMFLTRMFKFWLAFMTIDIAVFGIKCMFLFEMIRRLLADSVGLSGESANSNVRVESFSLCDEFKDVAFQGSLHC